MSSNSRLVDSRKVPIPTCNFTTSQKNKIYVHDVEEYEKYQSSGELYIYMSIITSLMTSVFACIFSLGLYDFSWTLSNIATFIFLIASSFLTFYSTQKWTENSIALDNLQQKGTLCTQFNEEDDSNIVYCSL